MKIVAVICIITIILLSACTGTAPPTTVPNLFGDMVIENNKARPYYIKISVSSGAIAGLTLSDVATVISVPATTNYDWTAAWENSIAGESQPLDVEVYGDETASGGIIWSGTLDVIDGITTTYKMTLDLS
jgi:hypothetical protein